MEQSIYSRTTDVHLSYGRVWPGMVGYDSYGIVWCRSVWYHEVCYGMGLYGMVWHAMLYNVMSSNSMHWCNIMQFNAMR